jgi:hypothetical protein
VHVRSFSKLERDVFNPGRMACLHVKELEAGLLFHSCLLSAIFWKSHPVYVFHFSCLLFCLVPSSLEGILVLLAMLRSCCCPISCSVLCAMLMSLLKKPSF